MAPRQQPPESIQDALSDAFDLQSLERMVRYGLGRDLEDYATGNKQHVIFKLITAAQREGFLEELVIAARKANPGNEKLQALRLVRRKAPPDNAALADRTKLPPVCPLPERRRMPFRPLGEKFIGRVDAFWKLHDSLFRDNTTVLGGDVVVVGTGGLGKTQLAIEYAHRFGSVYTGGVFWVDSDQGLSTLIAQVTAAAGVAIDTKADEARQLEQLWRELDGLDGPCLLMLDNFPEGEPLQPYLPVSGRVHTLITTRRQDLDYPSVRLDVLSTEEGIRLLDSGARKFGTLGARLVERLGGLPLALELAKGYLNYRKSLTMDALLEEMDAGGDVGLLQEFAQQYRDHLPTRHETDIAATFQMSWDIAPEMGKHVLRVMGELAPVAVPRALLRQTLNLAEGKGIRDELGNALDELARLSLVEFDPDGNPIAHRLILAFARHRNITDAASPFHQCLEAVQAQMQRASLDADARTLRELEPLVPHAEHLLAGSAIPPTEFSLLASRLGTHYSAQGRYRDARRAKAAALASDEKTCQPGHPDIARGQSNLALVLQELGELEAARDLLRKALASDERSYPPGHPAIARRQSNLALVLRDLGELEGARELLEKALASDERSYPPGHSSIAVRQSNLATVLKALGELEGARDLLGKALASDERSYPPGHPAIAIRRSNLATVLKDLGELEGARELLEKALASTVQTYPPGHPAIARDQSNLALVLKGLGELEAARGLLEKALASDERTYPPGHPAIARRQSNLAMVLKDLGELEAARDLLQEAYEALLSGYGPDFPLTRTVKGNLDSLRDS
ncbi:MAG: tetratricopeptide repeat protein [Bryobacterales bacterium]|nr:tetratricopeptide repeat protein [Bryobacterales bacterium]